MAFLKDGEEDMKIVSKSKQLTINTWMQTEMFCRKLILSVTNQSTAKSEFHSSLHDNLELFISSKSVANMPVWMDKECLESSQTVEHQQADNNGEKVSFRQEEKHPHADNPKLEGDDIEQSSSQGEVKHHMLTGMRQAWTLALRVRK